MSDQETFLSHLIELRQRLVRALLAVALCVLVLLPWARDVYGVLAQPLMHALPKGGQMIATDVIGPFFVPLKVTALVGFVLALPYVLYEAWAFVAPGLYVHEKKLVLPLVVASFVLFVAGMAFAYFLVFPMVFRFMAAVAPEGVAWMTDIDKYFSFVLSTFVAFGVTFEVPVVVILLVRAGIVSVQTLKSSRPYVIVGAFVVAAIFTPPDVLSQIMLAVPLILLFEAGLLVAGIIGAAPAADSAATAAGGEEGGSA